MQHFTFDVLDEAYGEQASYARRIVVSVFVPTDSTGYEVTRPCSARSITDRRAVSGSQWCSARRWT
jgi:hypothetical protein